MFLKIILGILSRLLTSFRALAPEISTKRQEAVLSTRWFACLFLHGRDSFHLKNTTRRRSKQSLVYSATDWFRRDIFWKLDQKSIPFWKQLAPIDAGALSPVPKCRSIQLYPRGIKHSAPHQMQSTQLCRSTQLQSSEEHPALPMMEEAASFIHKQD